MRISDLTIVYSNPRLEQIFAYDPGELFGRSVSTLFSAPDEAQAAAKFRAVVAGLEHEGDGTYELPSRKKDGTPFWCRARASRFEHPQFGPVWVAVHADITAEKEAVERLRRSERLLSAIFATIPVGLWVADADGRLIANNPSATRIWGGERMVGIERFDEYEAWRVDTGERLTAETWGVARAIQRGETSIGELLRIHGFDGSFRTILNSVMPVCDGDAILGAIAVNEDVTRLMEAEALSAGVVAAAPDAIVATDGERRIVVFNAVAERIFGYTRDEVLGRDVDCLIALEDRDALAHLLADADRQVHEPRVLVGSRRAGEAFPAEVSAACTQTGLLRRYTLVLRDITARLLAEDERTCLARALADERSWLRGMISNAPVGVATLDIGGKLRVNAHGEALLGTRGLPQEPTTYVGIMRHPDGTMLTHEELPLIRVLRGERVHAEEHLLVRPDGTRRSVLGSAEPVRDATGALLGVIGIFQDITELKRLEADLRFLSDAGQHLAESLDIEETLQTIAGLAVPHLADGCVLHVVEDEKHIRPAAFQCTPPEELPTLAALLRHGPRLGLTQRATEVARTGQVMLRSVVSPEELEQLAPSAELRAGLRRLGLSSYVTVPLRVRATTLGALTLFGTTRGRDVGEHELHLAGLLAARAGLALDNARLYRAARWATQARDDVLAIVAHDLRNPLSAILHATGVVEQSLRPDRPAGRRSAEAIRRGAIQMNRLIGDLLDIARIDAGTLALVRAPVAIGDLVAEAIDAARPLANGLELIAELPAGLPVISADRGRLLQIFGNLLDNAVKFTPPGGRIVVSAARVGDTLELRVADSGPGLSSALLEHVFDRFWQADRADRRGAGLGLTIVKGLVEAHGGAVRAESRPGAGATFILGLPLRAPTT